MTDRELFQDLQLTWTNLDEHIDAEGKEAFVKQFQAVMSCEVAKKLRSVVYIWYTDKPVPRLKGSSNILYIGKTRSTLCERHRSFAALEGSDGEHYRNWSRYKHIIATYGPMRFRCASVGNPDEMEHKMLWAYFLEHLELPPINRVG